MKQTTRTNSIMIRKLVLTPLLALLFLLGTSMRPNYMPEVVSMNGDYICYGMGPGHSAYIQMITPEIWPLAPDGRMEYIWRAEHENGTKVWRTAYPYREVPIFWSGPYTISVRVLLYGPGSIRPYAAFGSNTITVEGIACEELQDDPSLPDVFKKKKPGW